MDRFVIQRLKKEIGEMEMEEKTDSAISAGSAHAHVPLGIASLDRSLGGGLKCGALHEIHGGHAKCGASEGTLNGAHESAGAASAFALALAIRLASVRQSYRPHILWIQDTLSRHEAGCPYGPGLMAFGIDPDQLIFVTVKKAVHALWAMEEGLQSSALVAVIAEIWGEPAALSMDGTMTATRRLQLAAVKNGVTALLVRHGAAPTANAARARFRVTSAPGPPARLDASLPLDRRFILGLPAWQVALERNRAGATGRWPIAWSPHGTTFADPATLSLGVVSPFPDRPACTSGTERRALAV